MKNRLSKLGIILALWLAVISLHAQTGGSSTQNKVPGKTWTQMSSVEKAQMLCALSVGISFLVAEVWFIVAGFKTSVGWGLFMLFIGGTRSIFAILLMIAWMIQWTKLTHQSEPFHLPIMIGAAFVVFAGCGAIIFFVRHWEQARKPLAVMSFGVLSILAIVALQFVK